MHLTKVMELARALSRRFYAQTFVKEVWGRVLVSRWGKEKLINFASTIEALSRYDATK